MNEPRFKITVKGLPIGKCNICGFERMIGADGYCWDCFMKKTKKQSNESVSDVSKP